MISLYRRRRRSSAASADGDVAVRRVETAAYRGRGAVAVSRLPLPAGDVLLVGAVTAAGFGAWSVEDGGYAETVWYPLGLIFLILLVVAEWAGRPRRLGRAAAAALAALTAFTAWSFLSILWAGDRGLALTGANRTLVYLVVFALIARRGWRAVDAAAWTVVWALVVAGVGVVELAHAASSTGVSGFTAGRFAVPIDYANANAALFVLAAWPLVALAQARAAPALLRALGLAGAGVATELALLAQSKGAALATAATLIVAVPVVPRRVRVGIPVVLVAAAIAAFNQPLLGVYTDLNGSHPSTAPVRSALLAVALSALCLFVAGLLAAYVDRLLAERPRRSATLTRLAGVVAVLALAAGAVAVVHRFGSPVSIAERTWHAFVHPAQGSTASSHYASSAGNHRYDFWRTAARQFKSSPLTGAGVDNFSADYLLHRQSSEEPLYPHSLEARLLGETGLVGLLLFGAFFAAAALSCLRAVRARTSAAVAGLASLGMLAYWLAHASVDWLWAFPGLTGTMVAAAALCTSLDGGRPVEKRALALDLAGAVAAALALFALLPAWLAARDVSLATAGWRQNLSRSDAQLRQAASLNRLSDEPYTVVGTIAEQRRDWPAAEAWFAKALARNPRNWYSQLEEAVALDRRGDPGAALAHLRRAHSLDPGEPLVQYVLGSVRAGRAFSVASIDREVLERDQIRQSR